MGGVEWESELIKNVEAGRGLLDKYCLFNFIEYDEA